MAEIVIGVATSHSPQLSTPTDQWNLHVERDRKNQALHYRGQVYRFEALRELRRDEPFQQELDPAVWERKFLQWEERMAEIHRRLVAAAPEVAVVLGDDQREMFKDDGMPTFAVFWGEEARCIPLPPLHPSLEAARWSNYGEREESYPVDARLGQHIVETMMAEGFDVTQLTQQPQGRGIGHAFIFAKHRLLQEALPIPIVPVMINTYYPPNQPRLARCYAFGQALRRAIASYTGAKRVALITSGGLSHFVVDEALDRLFLDRLQARDLAALSEIPESYWTSGTSEVKNWVAAAGALEPLPMEVLDYIPAYRSEAGTGCGMAFAVWQ
ncbi:MAG: protocatechuate 3,4-dioxygenase [Firmicutes bacterium]|nr:protocatechuate 3,4-dioxygenase [Alicyclobacillaceae bacterium]MCL6498297.1 protocatechuate 3,4-dioxygenase [Bacillota bacterium]